MKQYRITTQNIDFPSPDDCVLPDDDPVHAMRAATLMGGLGSREALNQYRLSQLPKVDTTSKATEAREQGLEPGTPEWFEHWFKGAR